MFLSLALPVFASAQSPSASPIMVIGEDTSPNMATAKSVVPGADLPHFPENAITRVGENTTGQHVDAQLSPPAPVAPAAAAAAATPASPANPASPTPPASPISKLWPRDTVEVFLPSCTGLRPQYVIPCTCVITQLMLQMPHDEFLAKSADGTIEQDPRLIRIRTDCATSPTKKD